MSQGARRVASRSAERGGGRRSPAKGSIWRERAWPGTVTRPRARETNIAVRLGSSPRMRASWQQNPPFTNIAAPTVLSGGRIEGMRGRWLLLLLLVPGLAWAAPSARHFQKLKSMLAAEAKGGEIKKLEQPGP